MKAVNQSILVNNDDSATMDGRAQFEASVDELLTAVTTGHRLNANPRTNLAPFMYVEDNDDHRWQDGHSAETYYLGRDDKASHDLAMNDPIFDTIKVENYFDMGPGGKKAVLNISAPIALKLEAKNWFFFDRADALAVDAAEICEKTFGVNSCPVIGDFFEKLPIVKSNTAVSIPGGTIQNVETHYTPASLRRRMTQIFSNYGYAVTGRDRNQPSTSHLIVGFDANQNDHEIRTCYENDEFGRLVSGLAERGFDITGFAYHVELKRIDGIGFLSTGLRATRDLTTDTHTKTFRLKADAFVPVLNSNRMPVDFMEKAIREAGWKPSKTWTATGRSHYQHYTRA
jgi:hypothetical protein